MAKKKKGSRRAALKSFARKGSQAYPQKYQADKELVYGGGKNYKVTGDFADVDAGAYAADAAGYGFIYMNNVLYVTATGRARVANTGHTKNANAQTLDLRIG